MGLSNATTIRDYHQPGPLHYLPLPSPGVIITAVGKGGGDLLWVEMLLGGGGGTWDHVGRCLHISVHIYSIFQ